MNGLYISKQYCPYCGEPLELMIDCSVSSQNYIEDCQVCCRPVIVIVEIDNDGDPVVSLRNENE